MSDDQGVRICETCGEHKLLSEFQKFGRGWKKSCLACEGAPGGAPTAQTPPADASHSSTKQRSARAAKPERGAESVGTAAEKVLPHSNRLLSIALLGPREQDHDFLRALCARILQDTMVESGVKHLEDIPA